jgi:small subunit ribosomal protein S13
MKNRRDIKRKGLERAKRKRRKGKKKGVKYVMGQPLDGDRGVEKGLIKGRYGCGKEKAKEVRRERGRRKREKVGNREVKDMERMEGWMKEKRLRGSDRKRKENEARERERKRGTVRGMKIRRGLPVRGQRTSTNGMTARKLNGKRRSGRR